MRDSLLTILGDEKMPVDQFRQVSHLLAKAQLYAESSLLAANHLASKGASQIVLVGIIGATEGLEKLASQHPDLDIIVAGEDPQLNSKEFNVPGLGDFGDRYFGRGNCKTSFGAQMELCNSLCN